MARKFLYVIAGIIVLILAGAFALAIWGNELTRLALVPTAPFEEPGSLADNAYSEPGMWYARPGLSPDITDFTPTSGRDIDLLPAPADQKLGAAIFFLHPTSFTERSTWNAAIGDEDAEATARTFLRGLASPFSPSGDVWAPRYRQATAGAFLTQGAEAQQAFELAYGDVSSAFDLFLAEIGAQQPIVLAGHSQGAMHLLRLLADRSQDTALTEKIAAAYIIGWPVSLTHDLPQLGLPACANRNQTGCLVSYSSFAEPADPSLVLDYYALSTGFDGQPRGDSAILCTNPLTGGSGGNASADENLGTLVPDDGLKGGSLTVGAVPARCDERGLLLIGDPPDLGPYVLPGNNYHVYDIPLFWANLRSDAMRRVDLHGQAE